jgi:CHAT domain-containing protein
VQQGVERYQGGDLQGAIADWRTALNTYQEDNNLAKAAIVLENLARAYQATGQTSEAIAHWEQAINTYRQLADMPQMGRMLTEQSQAYSRLGQYRQAIARLCNAPFKQTCSPESALAIARGNHDQFGEAAALGSLGEAYRLTGDYHQAAQYLKAGLAIATAIDQPLYQISALNGLGNISISLAQVSYRRADSAARAGDFADANQRRLEGLEYDRQALRYFQQSLTLAQKHNDQHSQIRALIGAIAPSYRRGDAAIATTQIQQARSLLGVMPNSQDKVYAAIDLAILLQPIAPIVTVDPSQFPYPPVAQEPDEELDLQRRCMNSAAIATQATELLQQAVAIAQQIGDRRSESFALGELGKIYECHHNYEQALNFTQQAQWTAEQDLRAKDSLYLWEWQMGRLLKEQGKIDEAIAAYERAIATLEDIRSDLLIANRDLQFDFRDTVDPIYRELIALRLAKAPASIDLSQVSESKQNMDIALERLDSLRLAELQNYFGNDCVIIAVNEGEDFAKKNTAVFSSIILKDRTAIVVSFPDGKQQLEWINVDNKDLRAEINRYRFGLESASDPVYHPQQAQKIYQWIIEPFAPALEQAEINTLVFIQDGILRSVPMAALHDGEQFLIQKYAIATTPSKTLTDPEPVDRQHLRALALGLTERTVVGGQTFPPLDNVGNEISAVTDQLPGSQRLLNQEFTRDRLQQELSQDIYPIIHIATHGEFGTEPQDTFLVTGDNQKLTITDLDTMLRSTALGNPIELLSLTACKTAVGDDRATLGLAGVAVQAGAKSALASLWYIADDATAQIASQFYANLLKPDVSKAEALRAAQVSVIEAGGQTAHPAYWAPFLLIGSWL